MAEGFSFALTVAAALLALGAVLLAILLGKNHRPQDAVHTEEAPAAPRDRT
ncbi:hypothetical protein ACFV8E_29640 [Streptomyces sp. NPDC059849]|uniref:hypothetical protein n=1 Tax=Streptomyces sp. NPDC059849 TaxID=3346969 RepID=UPI0036460AAD